MFQGGRFFAALSAESVRLTRDPYPSPGKVLFNLKNSAMKFEQYVPEANRFLKEVAHELGNAADANHAYRMLRNVLHTIREILSLEESSHLISQLPLLIKGVYVDGWKMQTNKRIRSRKEFLERLRSKSDLPDTDLSNDEEAINKVQGVLYVLQQYISAGEMAHIINQFPAELTELWRLPAKESL